ncbi:hypothetical protein [Burkholderia sp. IMCC1007]|uniref:hypothetical protein n=1 Tax=Burkholderia sp. IMCC1007 TaxID=3004104 RepID=UPI0022B4C8B1|nr:hypothetical protein [Burkholderia sp. IMCC1007]
MKHPQFSRRANSPTMFRTIGAARASGLLADVAGVAVASRDRARDGGRERPGSAPRQIDNLETR